MEALLQLHAVTPVVGFTFIIICIVLLAGVGGRKIWLKSLENGVDNKMLIT